MDRRTLRSRNLLQQALLSLILKKDYEAITVQDICERANVGRSTFYEHYAGKDDLKRSGLDHLRKMLVERQKVAGDEPFVFSLPMFEHARDHIDHYRALAGGRGGIVSLERIRGMLTDLIRKEISADPLAATETVPREAVVQYVVGAYMAMLTWWLDGGAKLPPEQVDALFRRLATSGVTTYASVSKT